MGKRKIYVETPRGIIREVKHRNGKVGMKLEWADDFRPRRQKDFENAQQFVDSECIRLMKKYTPFKTGILEKSATLGTDIGSGEIKQVAPYARYQYYGELMVSSKTGSSYSKGERKVLTGIPLEYSKSAHPNAGKMWFERMKAVHREQILKGASKIVGGKQ